MPLEDFNTYIEYDPLNRITIDTPNHFTFRCCEDEARLFKDKGVDHFHDFTHHVDMMMKSGNAGGYYNCWMLSNTETGSGSRLAVLGYRTAAMWYIYLREFSGAYPFNQLSWNGAAPNKWYYLIIRKAGLSFTLEIYSDPERTTLVYSMALTLTQDYFMRYIIAARHRGAAGSGVYIEGETANLDLREVVVPQGYLDATALADSTSISASLEVVGVGTYALSPPYPNRITLSPGTYDLVAKYAAQTLTDTVTITEGTVSPVTFQFMLAPTPLGYTLRVGFEDSVEDFETPEDITPAMIETARGYWAAGSKKWVWLNEESAMSVPPHEPNQRFEPSTVQVRSGLQSARLALETTTAKCIHIQHTWDELTDRHIWCEGWYFIPPDFNPDDWTNIHRALAERWWGETPWRYEWFQIVQSVMPDFTLQTVLNQGWVDNNLDNTPDLAAPRYIRTPNPLPVGEWFKITTYVYRNLENFDNGIFRLWINDVLIHDEVCRTVGVDPARFYRADGTRLPYWGDRKAWITSGISLYSSRTQPTSAKELFVDDVMLSNEQTPPPLIPNPRTISGTIVDAETGLPISEASVRANALFVAFSNPDGTFDLTVEAGVYALTVAKAGYETRILENIDATGNITLVDPIALQPTPTPMPPCFIATVAYGSPLEPQLNVFRIFRARCLPAPLVDLYYRLSPPLAKFIKGRRALRRYVRGWLDLLAKIL